MCGRDCHGTRVGARRQQGARPGEAGRGRARRSRRHSAAPTSFGVRRSRGPTRPLGDAGVRTDREPGDKAEAERQAQAGGGPGAGRGGALFDTPGEKDSGGAPASQPAPPESITGALHERRPTPPRHRVQSLSAGLQYRPDMPRRGGAGRRALLLRELARSRAPPKSPNSPSPAFPLRRHFRLESQRGPAWPSLAPLAPQAGPPRCPPGPLACWPAGPGTGLEPS